MKKEEFEIRFYGKSELAMAYYQDDSKKNALYKNVRRYSPKEVKVIVDELGEPY